MKVQEDQRRAVTADAMHGSAAAKFKSTVVEHGKLRIHSHETRSSEDNSRPIICSGGGSGLFFLLVAG